MATNKERHAPPGRCATTGTGIASRPLVGKEIRRWRHERGLTLARVAELSGLNLGYLSQIENDKASPSLDALAAIGAALDVPIAWFLLAEAPPPRVVRAGDRPRLRVGKGHVTEVDGGHARDVRILEAHVPGGTRTGLHAHAGEEHHVVLSGQWRMSQGDHSFDLGCGDYLSWDASVPHDVENIGSEPASMLVIYARRGRGTGGSRTPAE